MPTERLQLANTAEPRSAYRQSDKLIQNGTLETYNGRTYVRKRPGTGFFVFSAWDPAAGIMVYTVNGVKYLFAWADTTDPLIPNTTTLYF